tara:strand:- start:2628 stop:3347 length:720 start_codon:yes stop_codon:yes gene_type:complete
MNYKILVLIFLSLGICKNEITQITDIYPGGKPKEITIYEMKDNANSNFTILPSKRYLYHPNGKLHKYQEFWGNGQKSLEVLIQRHQVIERHWDIEGFPKDTEKFKLENYNIPSIATKQEEGGANLSSLSAKIEKMKRDLTTLSLNVREITNNLNSFDQNNNALNQLNDLVTQNINILNNEISQLQQQINILNGENNKSNESNNYKNFKKDINKKIDDIEDEIKTIQSDLKSGKKKKKRK